MYSGWRFRRTVAHMRVGDMRKAQTLSPCRPWPLCACGVVTRTIAGPAAAVLCSDADPACAQRPFCLQILIPLAHKLITIGQEALNKKAAEIQQVRSAAQRSGVWSTPSEVVVWLHVACFMPCCMLHLSFPVTE